MRYYPRGRNQIHNKFDKEYEIERARVLKEKKAAKALKARMEYLPIQIEATRQKLRALILEADRLGLSDIILIDDRHYIKHISRRK